VREIHMEIEFLQQIGGVAKLQVVVRSPLGRLRRPVEVGRQKARNVVGRKADGSGLSSHQHGRAIVGAGFRRACAKIVEP